MNIWEGDLGTPLVLFDAKKDGKTIPAIAVMRTDGNLFELDRATGKPVFPIEERPGAAEPAAEKHRRPSPFLWAPSRLARPARPRS